MRRTVVAICLIAGACTPSGSDFLDDYTGGASSECKELCSRFVDCRFGVIEGNLSDSARDDATSACRASCRYGSEEGLYVYDSNDGRIVVKRQIDPATARSYLKCLLDGGVYRCIEDDFVNAANEDRATCENYAQCVAILGIDATVEWSQQYYDHCHQDYNEQIYPDFILGDD